MKRVIFSIVLIAIVFSCKNEKKETEAVQTESEQKKVEVEPVEKTKLPENTIQLNEEPIVSNGITLTKVHVQNINDENFIYKIFFITDNIELYKNGDYSLFIQNFPYEDDKYNLEENYQKSGVASYWVNLKSAKQYKEEYVVFKSFKSKIYDFQKAVIGVMNLKEKTDIFRTQYDDIAIVKE